MLPALKDHRCKFLPWLVAVCVLSRCAGVKVTPICSHNYVSARRSDILTTGQISVSARTALNVVGWDARLCAENFPPAGPFW
jgi:hypothetical protein